MPHLIGIQLHSDGLGVAAMRPDQTIALRSVGDMASVIERTSAQPWKWSLGADGRDAEAVAAAHELFLGLQHAMGDDSILAAIAVPAIWNDRKRRSLLLAMEDTSVETMRLVRDTTALAAAATTLNPSLSGLCAIAHVGTHKLEVTLAEVTRGTIQARSRQSVMGLSGSNMRPESMLPLISEVARFATREAGLAAGDVRHFLCAGRRAAEPTLAKGLATIWGLPAQVFPEGVIAIGAAHIAVGLTGLMAPWNLLDDLDESPLANFRGKPRRRTTGATPTPARKAVPVDVYRAPAAPPARPDLRDVVVARAPVVERPPVAPPSMPMSAHVPSDEAHDRSGRISEHSSIAPTSGRIVEVRPSGSFVGLPTLDSVRALHLIHPSEVDALAHPTLAAMLNQFTFLRALSGTLTLRHNAEEVVLHIERGGVCLTPSERARALHPFDWSDGTYSWHPEKIAWAVQKHRVPMTGFVVAGLRIRLRNFDDGVFAQGHLSKLRLAPSVLDDRRSRLARLGLPEAEERAVDYVLDGTRSFEKILGEGYIGRTTMHRLVVLLDLYGILDWLQPAAAVVEDPVAVMAALLARIDTANHFVALGVHWSAPEDEIRAAFEKMQTTYGMGGSWQRHDPALAARIMARSAAAWAVLRLDVTRVKHRRDAYPGMDEELLAPLVEARAKALQMRGESREAARMMQLHNEFHFTPTPKPKT